MFSELYSALNVCWFLVMRFREHEHSILEFCKHCGMLLLNVLQRTFYCRWQKFWERLEPVTLVVVMQCRSL